MYLVVYQLVMESTAQTSLNKTRNEEEEEEKNTQLKTFTHYKRETAQGRPNHQGHRFGCEIWNIEKKKKKKIIFTLSKTSSGSQLIKLIIFCGSYGVE